MKKAIWFRAFGERLGRGIDFCSGFPTVSRDKINATPHDLACLSLVTPAGEAPDKLRLIDNASGGTWIDRRTRRGGEESRKMIQSGGEVEHKARG